MQAAESFKSCSYQALGKILAEAPSEGRAATTTAMPSLQVGWAWMAVVRGRTGGAKKDPAVDYRGWWAGAACELMRAQVLGTTCRTTTRACPTGLLSLQE